MFFAFFLFPKFLELTGVWLYSLAQEAVPSATDESLEDVTVFDFKSFVMPWMRNWYIRHYAGGRGGVGDNFRARLI